MFRILSNPLLKSAECVFGGNPQCLQFYRWRRKPRWLPVAKSKLFRVPERKVQPPGEKEELLRLHNQYRTQMRSIRLYLRKEVQRIKETSTADHLVVTPEEEEAEFQKRLAENDAWNAKIAEERNARLQKQKEEKKKIILERLRLAEEVQEERRQKIEEIVRKEKERAKTFITRENLDNAIEHALANPTDHNFALDLQGRMYIGREAKTPAETPLPDSEKVASINS